MDNYLNMLKDSLVKKERNLSSLIALSEKQGVIVREEKDVDWDEFNKVADEKSTLIEEILKLDEGFEMLYEHIKEGLEDNKEKYRDVIIEIKTLVKSVT